MKKKVYLSGPITADKEHYKEHFAKIEEYLTNLGFDVTNPSKDEYDDEIYEKGHADKWTEKAWLDYIARDIELVSEHDIVCVLKGWQKSLGALIELAVAKRYGISIMFEGENKIYPKWDFQFYGLGVDPLEGYLIQEEMDDAKSGS